MNSLQNKVALITGGTKGIGFGIAQSLLNEGIHVAITGRNETTLTDAVSQLKSNSKTSAKVMAVQSDVRDYENQVLGVKKVLDTFGKLDIVIANAGLGHFDSVENISIQQWQETIDTNLSGAFYTLKASADALKNSKGYYITISSLAGTNFFQTAAAYNASKFGLTGFTQAAMLDLRKYGIKVSTIMPGSVATYFRGNEPSSKDDWKIQIEDIGELVVDLLKMNPRTLPSKIEVRPSMPPGK